MSENKNTLDWARPKFQVRDLSESLRYYCAKLGFTIRWVFGGAEHNSTPAGDLKIPDAPMIAEVERNGIEIILDQNSSQPAAAVPSVICVELHDYDTLDLLHEKMCASNAKVTTAPFKVDWAEDTMQMEIEDLDGNIIVFWGNINQ